METPVSNEQVDEELPIYIHIELRNICLPKSLFYLLVVVYFLAFLSYQNIFKENSLPHGIVKVNIHKTILKNYQLIAIH